MKNLWTQSKTLVGGTGLILLALMLSYPLEQFHNTSITQTSFNTQEEQDSGGAFALIQNERAFWQHVNTPHPNLEGPGLRLVFQTRMENTDTETVVLTFNGQVNAQIDWGRERANLRCPRTITQAGNVSCRFETEGFHNVKITGTIEQWGDGPFVQDGAHRNRLVGVIGWDGVDLQRLDGALAYSRRLITVPDTLPPSVYSLSSLFYHNPKHFPNLAQWDVSNVSVFSNTFAHSGQRGDLSSWNVTNGQDFSRMFLHAERFQDNLSSWNVAQGERMTGMFQNATRFDSDMSSWNVSQNRDFSRMFENTQNFQGPLTGWNVTSGETFENMFAGSSLLDGNLSTWTFTGRPILRGMFHNARQFNADLSTWCFERDNEPQNFETGATSWTSPRPRWNQCERTTETTQDTQPTDATSTP